MRRAGCRSRSASRAAIRQAHCPVRWARAWHGCLSCGIPIPIRARFIVDTHVSKRIPFGDRCSFELLGELFNALNHQNVTGVATNGYAISQPTGAVTPLLTYQPNFGSVQTTNSNYIYSPRQVQIGERFNF